MSEEEGSAGEFAFDDDEYMSEDEVLDEQFADDATEASSSEPTAAGPKEKKATPRLRALVRLEEMEECEMLCSSISDGTPSTRPMLRLFTPSTIPMLRLLYV
ncbi:unnamed protein product [Zymoseptoria tritici ST99CH_3D1]|nr:unnamed protein product [Zymoseptoria tritici ST99CH_3D1]